MQILEGKNTKKGEALPHPKLSLPYLDFYQILLADFVHDSFRFYENGDNFAVVLNVVKG